MIHDSLVPVLVCGVALVSNSTEFQLITGTRSSRVHRWRRSGQALVDKQLDLDAPVLRTTFFCIVFRNGIHLAITIRGDDATQRNLVVLNEVTDNSIRTTLAQLAIEVDAAARIRITGNLEHVTFRVHRLAGELVQSRLRIRREHCTAGLEVDSSSVLRLIVVERRDALVGGVDAGNRGISRGLRSLRTTTRGVGNSR